MSYLSVGHTGNCDSWVLPTSKSDIVLATQRKINIEEFHDYYLNKYMADFSGRLDHDKKIVSIVSQGGDKERLEYLLTILKMDYPDYEIRKWSNSLDRYKVL